MQSHVATPAQPVGMSTQAPPLAPADGSHVAAGVLLMARQYCPGAQVVLPQGIGWSSPASAPVHENPPV